DWRDLIQARFAELAFDVELHRKTESAVSLQTDVGGFPGGLRSQHFCHVGFGSARLMVIEQACSFVAHQISRSHASVTLCDGKLDALVFGDGAIENDSFVGVCSSLVDEPISVANAFSGDKNAFGVHPIEDVAKARSFIADEVLCRDLEVVEKDFVGLMI